MSRIVILGSGAWGTAIALSLHRRGGHRITLWAHTHELARQILDAGENTQFLPGFLIPSAITVTGECEAASDADIVVSSIPSEFLRSAFSRVGPHLHAGQIVLSATKGIEDRTFLRMTEVIADCLKGAKAPASSPESLVPGPKSRVPGPEFLVSDPESLVPSPCLFPIGALSGPSFALEVAQGQPTAVTVAFSDPANRRRHPAGVLLRVPPPLHLHRRHRCRAGRRAQERHRHRRRNRRGRRPRSQLHRRSHHPRHRRNHAPRCRLRRPQRNPRRPLRRGRPGAHLHRLAQPQPGSR